MENIDQLFPKRNIKKIYIGTIIASIFVMLHFLFSAPALSVPATIHVASRESLNIISTELKNKKVIRSVIAFEFFVKLWRGDKAIQTGDYFFESNFSVYRVAWMLARGIHNVDPVRITLREGLTNDQVGVILANNLPNFDREKFILRTNGKQGRLFPDTYFIFPLATADEIAESMENNFQSRIKPLEKQISASGHRLNEIVTMASIIEKESNGKDDAPLISGILWKRIRLKMPLQVDASPVTYKATGLPEEPISNPGLLSIKAAISPTESSYLYYLHDKSGMIHFASTYKEHKDNISKYLK